MMDLLIAQRMVMLLPQDAAKSYDLEYLRGFALMAQDQVQEYCGRTFTAEDKTMITVMARVAVINLQRVGTDGLTAQSYSGVNESYVDGYPADILAILNRKRKVKLL